MNKSYIGHEYFCPQCKFFFTATEELLDEIELSHVNGEVLDVVTISCPVCESFSVPEGMNQIAWLKDDMNLKESDYEQN